MCFCACSILKYQLSTDILDENVTCISDAISFIKKVLSFILFRYC